MTLASKNRNSRTKIEIIRLNAKRAEVVCILSNSRYIHVRLAWTRLIYWGSGTRLLVRDPVFNCQWCDVEFQEESTFTCTQGGRKGREGGKGPGGPKGSRVVGRIDYVFV